MCSKVITDRRDHYILKIDKAPDSLGELPKVEMDICATCNNKISLKLVFMKQDIHESTTPQP